MERKKFLNVEEKAVLDLITFNRHWALAGSQNDPNIFFSMDYDANQFLDKVGIPTILRQFPHKVKKLVNTQGVYLGDIKTQIGDTKIRWSKKEIVKGETDDGVSLKEQLEEHTVFFKIDVIAFLPFTGSFHEFTNTLFYRRSTPKKDMTANIKQEAQEYQQSGEPYKALKRWYSYWKLQQKPNKYKPIREILNDPLLGTLHQMREGLDSLIYLLENHKLTIKNKRFQTDLQGFKEMLWHTSQAMQSQKIKQILRLLDTPSLNKLTQIRDDIAEALKHQTRSRI